MSASPLAHVCVRQRLCTFRFLRITGADAACAPPPALQAHAPNPVIPAKAGISSRQHSRPKIPACAGMTGRLPQGSARPSRRRRAARKAAHRRCEGAVGRCPAALRALSPGWGAEIRVMEAKVGRQPEADLCQITSQPGPAPTGQAARSFSLRLRIAPADAVEQILNDRPAD